jgi:hypothetical protein
MVSSGQPDRLAHCLLEVGVGATDWNALGPQTVSGEQTLLLVAVPGTDSNCRPAVQKLCCVHTRSDVAVFGAD